MKIQKGDMVLVIAGNEKGKQGKVLKVFPDKRRVIVEGINLCKKHVKPNQKNPQGGIQEQEATVHVSNVMLVHNNDRTRVGYTRLEDGKKVRQAKASGEVID